MADSGIDYVAKKRQIQDWLLIAVTICGLASLIVRAGPAVSSVGKRGQQHFRTDPMHAVLPALMFALHGRGSKPGLEDAGVACLSGRSHGELES